LALTAKSAPAPAAPEPPATPPATVAAPSPVTTPALAANPVKVVEPEPTPSPDKAQQDAVTLKVVEAGPTPSPDRTQQDAVTLKVVEAGPSPSPDISTLETQAWDGSCEATLLAGASAETLALSGRSNSLALQHGASTSDLEATLRDKEVLEIQKDLEKQVSQEFNNEGGATQGQQEDEEEEKAAAAAAEAARLAMATAAAALEAAKAKKQERLQREAKEREMRERKELEMRTLELLAKEQREREAREREAKEKEAKEKEAKEREAREREAKEKAAQEAKEQAEARARELQEIEAKMKEKETLERQAMMKEAKERETQARLAREAKEREEAKQRVLSEARPLKREAERTGQHHTQDGVGDSVGRTLVEPDASAATMAKSAAPNLSALPKASKVARTGKALKDDEFALPVLSDAEKGKYKVGGFIHDRIRRYRIDECSSPKGHTVSRQGIGKTVSRNRNGVSQSSDYSGSSDTAARDIYTQCAGPEQLQPIVDAIAKLFVQQPTAAAPATPEPHAPPAVAKSAPPMPPPPPPAHAEPSPAPATAAPAAAAAAPGPAPAGRVPYTDPVRINSDSHPAEYKRYTRFCERKGGAFKLAAFQKFVQAGCNGLALEAVMRFKRQHEDMSQDEGHYYPYEDILGFFSNNAARAVQDASWTSTDRNNPDIKTYLYYQREKRSLTTRSLDEICIELGAEASWATQVAQILEQGHDPNKTGLGAISAPPAAADNPNPGKGGGKGEPGGENPPPPPPKKKARAPKRQGSELEIDITQMLATKDFQLSEFVTNWAAPYVEAFKKHSKVAANLSLGNIMGIVKAGLLSELNEDSIDLVEFWNQARSEDWGANMLIISWSPLASSKESMYSKFPYCVIKSDFFHYDGDKNVTLSHLQHDLVMSLNQCSDKGNGLGATLHVVAGKGDWKWRKEWLQQTRFYGKVTHGSHGICPRCFAAKNDWVDVKERFNNDEDVARAQETAVGENIAMKQLSGWSCNMEVPDLLHCIWLGTGRDLVGSRCLEMAETRQDLVGATYDQRLASLRKDIQAWCAARGIRPSTIDELSFSFFFKQPGGGEVFIFVFLFSKCCWAPAINDVLVFTKSISSC
ncbi:Cpr, partial [Symbiodinium sp. KB8]